jgi:hypothetical protein
MTTIFAFLVGQSCRSALNFWAAQRRPTDDVKVFVLRSFRKFSTDFPRVSREIPRISPESKKREF